jgi:hypothetical protein
MVAVQKEFKPIVCVDFDGTLTTYRQGWQGARVTNDDAVPGAIDALLRLVDAGFIVAIHSSRSGQWGGRHAMKRWLALQLRRHYLSARSFGSSERHVESVADAIRLVSLFSFPRYKPAATLTIDDRAICFDGDWDAITPDKVRKFTPWHKHPSFNKKAVS